MHIQRSKYVHQGSLNWWGKEVRMTLVYFVCSLTHTRRSGWGNDDTFGTVHTCVHAHAYTAIHAHRHCSEGHVEVNVKEDLVFSGARRLINTDLERTAGGRGGHTHKANKRVRARASSKKYRGLFLHFINLKPETCSHTQSNFGEKLVENCCDLCVRSDFYII